MPPAPVAFLLLMAVNILTFIAFGHDKCRAVSGGRRIPENDLLLLALIGGSPAAFAARRVFRHKTRKQPFSIVLHLIGMAQTGALMGWFIV